MKHSTQKLSLHRVPVPLPYAGLVFGILALAVFCWLMIDAALGGAA